MLIEILSIIAPVFICTAIGFGWARSGHPFDSQQVSTLVMNIGAPCLIVGTLGRVDMPADYFNEILLATGIVVAITLLLAFVTCALLGVSARTYVAPLAFPNTGNMGLPLSLFAFGEPGLAVALAVFLVISFVHFSLGVALVSGRGGASVALRSPVVIAAAIAMALVYTNSQLPQWCQDTLDLLGGLSIPLMLITLGVSLARLRVADLKLSAVLSVARLLTGAVAGVVAVLLLDLKGVVAGVLILQSTMPAAVFNYLLAQRYGRSPEAVAGTVVFSTLFSIIWLPFLLGWLLSIE